MYPILSLMEIHSQCRLINNIINIIDTNTFEIKLKYIHIDTLFFEDFYICHEFYFVYKDNKFNTYHTIKQHDNDDEFIINNYFHEYSYVKLNPPTNIIEFLFLVHNSSISDLSENFNSIWI
jgi:hypothetical protein